MPVGSAMRREVGQPQHTKAAALERPYVLPQREPVKPRPHIFLVKSRPRLEAVRDLARRRHDHVVQIMPAAADPLPHVADVGHEAAWADVADHAGRGHVIEDARLLAVVALVDLPAMARLIGQQRVGGGGLVAGVRPADDIFKCGCSARATASWPPFPGNGTPVCVHECLAEVDKTSFEVEAYHNDRHNYALTARHWAENLDRHADTIVRRWGLAWYRRFRLWLWGCVDVFSRDHYGAYRLILRAK